MLLLACMAEPEPVAPPPPVPADFAAIAAEERVLHPEPRWGIRPRPGESRVVDFRGRPVAGASVTVQGPKAPATPILTDAEGRWTPPESGEGLVILVSGWSRVAYGASGDLSGDARVVRGPRTLGALADQTTDPTERAWITAELLMGEPEGEDGPSEGGMSSPDEVADNAWRTGARLLPELRGFAALPCDNAWDIGCRARQMLADEADPQDDARIALRRNTPITPVSAPSVEALCGAWEKVVQAREKEGLPPAGCQIGARRADVARLSLHFTFAHWGFELEGIARLEGGTWRLIDERNGTHWDAL